MPIHEIALSILATITSPATTAGDVKAKELPDQYFCCDWVDPSGGGGAGTGGGCVKTTEDNINGCAHWLICPGGATGSDGVVTCTATKKTEGRRRGQETNP